MKIKLAIVFVFLQFLAFSQTVKKIATFNITVSDMDRSLKFYTEVLNFKKESDTELFGEEYEKLTGIFGLRIRTTILKLGDEKIQLTDFITTGGRPIPADSRSNDLWFQHIAIVVSDMGKAYQQLRKFNVEHVSTGPQTLPPTLIAAAGIQAFYFHDPDGHNLELICFPEAKGDPKWQKNKTDLFLGIDHSAIGISNTKQSLDFYNKLGLKLAGESYNYGNEQEHLNNVKGASLHISGLRSQEGPGVEFLEYLKPGKGRSYPSDAKADDLIHWETILETDNSELLIQKLRDEKIEIVSEGLVTADASTAGFSKAFRIRDPDGHFIRVIER